MFELLRFIQKIILIVFIYIYMCDIKIIFNVNIESLKIIYFRNNITTIP